MRGIAYAETTIGIAEIQTLESNSRSTRNDVEMSRPEIHFRYKAGSLEAARND